MSIKVMSHVWETSKQKGSALLLLLAIADHADEERRAKAEADAERLRRALARLPWWVRMLWARDT